MTTMTPLNGARVTPRNQLGEPATTTRDETIARLTEKVSRNGGGANRARIRARIRERLAIKV